MRRPGALEVPLGLCAGLGFSARRGFLAGLGGMRRLGAEEYDEDDSEDVNGSDEGRRDSQFNGRIMDTATYPTATFKLAQPIELASLPADGATITAKALGQLTLHGTTRQVAVDVSAQRSASSIRLSGQIPVSFADWNIPNPSFGPASTEDHGLIEFLLVLARA